jgi:hypothetical protein
MSREKPAARASCMGFSTRRAARAKLAPPAPSSRSPHSRATKGLPGSNRVPKKRATEPRGGVTAGRAHAADCSYPPLRFLRAVAFFVACRPREGRGGAVRRPRQRGAASARPRSAQSGREADAELLLFRRLRGQADRPRRSRAPSSFRSFRSPRAATSPPARRRTRRTRSSSTAGADISRA